MDVSLDENRARALAAVKDQLGAAAAARKCHGCGCLHRTVEVLSRATAKHPDLAATLAEARRAFIPEEYDCLGCRVCYPAIAANAFAGAFPTEGEQLDLCPTDEPNERRGWPPLPGDYHVIRYHAPVAICTLNSADLAARLGREAPEGVALVGTLHTENLGIERIVRNVLANPHIRYLLLCGEDTIQAIGHLPGQSLTCLLSEGLDERGRIVGALGKRPLLKNVRRDQVEAFRRQVALVPLVGEERVSVVLERVGQCVASNPGPFEGAPAGGTVEVVPAASPRRLVSDPVGYFIVYPDTPRRCLVVEHYTTEGVLDCALEAVSPAAIYATAIERGLLSRLDHAAYLGRELARAERTLLTGEPYVQDRAPGEADGLPPAPSCGCGTDCNPGESP